MDKDSHMKKSLEDLFSAAGIICISFIIVSAVQMWLRAMGFNVALTDITSDRVIITALLSLPIGFIINYFLRKLGIGFCLQKEDED